MKVISLAGTTCDLETEMLILTMYFFKVFENVKYLRKVFKYKYRYSSYSGGNTECLLHTMSHDTALAR